MAEQTGWEAPSGGPGDTERVDATMAEVAALGGDHGADVLALLAAYYGQHGGQLGPVLRRPEVRAEFSNWHR